MDIKTAMNETLEKLEKLKEPIQSSPESSKPSESETEKIKRVSGLMREIPSLMSRYGIPSKFINKNFILPVNLKGFLENNRGLCLTGKAGVGKTMSMCLLVRDWLIDRAERTNATYWGPSSSNAWKFISFPEFIMQVQDSFRRDRGDETAYSILKEIARVPFLIMDDLGAEKATEYVRQATYYLINHREMHELPTFITTNFSMDHLDENIDPRISSRICGMCEIIRFDGRDQRIKKELAIKQDKN